MTEQDCEGTRFRISPECWEEVVSKMPIVCVDAIVECDKTVLLGWRSIPPYREMWALPGGRMWFGDTFEKTAVRQTDEIGLKIRNVHHVGIYPITFHSRHDVSICMCSQWRSEIPNTTKEMAHFRWVPTGQLLDVHPMGENYRRMLHDWLDRR